MYIKQKLLRYSVSLFHLILNLIIDHDLNLLENMPFYFLFIYITLENHCSRKAKFQRIGCSRRGHNIYFLHTFFTTQKQARYRQFSGQLLSCQPKSDSDVMFCLQSYQGLITKEHLCINPIHRIGLIHMIYRFMFAQVE